jgi:hypothetical protein
MLSANWTSVRRNANCAGGEVQAAAPNQKQPTTRPPVQPTAHCRLEAGQNQKEIIMTLPTKITALAALLLAVALSRAQAQTTQTDEVLVLNFQLSTIAQGPAASVRGVIVSPVQTAQITSRDVIKTLGASIGNTFTGAARLELLTPTNNLQDWTVQIHDGTRVVDVTDFFRHQPTSGSVSSAFLVNRTGAAGEVEYSIDNFSLVDQPGYPSLSLHFNVSGLTATTESGFVNRRGQVVGQIDQISGKVSGTGDSNGAFLLIQGSVNAAGTSTETVTTAPPVAS